MSRHPETEVLHVGEGARADLVLLDAPSHVHLAYRTGVPLVSAVWRAGERVGRLNQMAEEAGRSRIPVTVYGAIPREEVIAH